MRVLIACEFSGVVRRAFLSRGCDAWSCDVLPAEDGSDRHLRRDVLGLLGDGWDLMIAHPPWHASGSQRGSLVRWEARRTSRRAGVRPAVA